MSPLSWAGREPPETATVKRPFFWMDSFCALMMNWARESTSSAWSANEQRMGADGACVKGDMADDE